MAQIKTEPLTDYYEVKEELGRGRFAVVKRCVKISTSEVYAAKCIRKARAGRRGREQLLLEIDILHSSDHPKMVKLFDVFETRSEMILILEYAAGGDLHKHCLEIEAVRTEKEICSLIYQIVEAASYLHENHVVHLDLKPENILLKNDEKFPEIRLIDFGLSRRVDLPYSQYDIVGTPEYVAPEVLSYEAIKISADMWSIGVVCYVLLSGISPFAGDDVMETYGNIANVDFDFDAEEFDDISDEAKDFIESLLIKDPKERLTTRECLEHPWLKQMACGVQREDIEAALIAEEAFEKLIRKESISRLESGVSVSSSENDTQEEGEQATSNDDLSDATADDIDDDDDNYDNDNVGNGNDDEAESKGNAVLLEKLQPNEDDLAAEDSCPDLDVEVREEVELGVTEAGKHSKPERKSSSSGGFDIDSLICKDDQSGTKESVQGGEQTRLLSCNDINANFRVSEQQETRMGFSDTVEPCRGEKSSNFESKVSDRIMVEKRADSWSKDKKSEQESSEKGSSSVGIDLRKGISPDAVLASRSVLADSKVDVSDSKTILSKAASCEDILVSSRQKSSEAPKGSKLGAHLEKLSKAGLHVVNDFEKKHYDESGNSRRGSIKKFDSHESKVEVGAKEAPPSSKSSGSSTPTSGRGTPDLSSICIAPESKRCNQDTDNAATPEEKAGTEHISKENPMKVHRSIEKAASSDSTKSTPAIQRKTSTPSSEKLAYPKKQSLGVPQGIAAQMASKFSSSVDRGGAQSPSKVSKSASQPNVSNRKYWEAATPESKRSDLLQSKKCSLKLDRTLFSNAIKVAKGEASQDQTVELERMSKSPKNSPKLSRAKDASEMQVKNRAEQYMKAAADFDGKNKTQVCGFHAQKIQLKASNLHDNDDLLEKNAKKATAKENILQKFEKDKKHENHDFVNSVNVQPKGLQFSFNLQTGNKFKVKEANAVRNVDEANSIKLAPKAAPDGKKTVTFDAVKNASTSRRKAEPVTSLKSFSGMLEEDETLDAQSNDHVEHTAIGALGMMPRTPLRELRSKSRTSRDGGGSPSSPRKAYRRLYVTHVKGSKSEHENEVSEDIADIKTKMDKDELKVELLVKFGTL